MTMRLIAPRASLHVIIDSRTGQRTCHIVRPFMTTMRLGSGWAAVMFWWNPEGFWEPWDTRKERFFFEEPAALLAKKWAKEHNVTYQRREPC